MGNANLLSYRPQREESRLRPWQERIVKHRRALIVGACLLAVVVAIAEIPTSSSMKMYVCRDCGLTKVERKSAVMGIPYQEGVTYNPAGSMFYVQYVGVPHQHDWIGDATSITSGHLLVGGHGVACGHLQTGRWPRSQIDVTTEALMQIDRFAAEPATYRRSIYQQMLSCPTRQQVEALAKNAANALKLPPEVR